MDSTAERTLEDTVWRMQDELGADHPRLELPLLAIAALAAERGSMVRARAIVRRVLAMRILRLGPEDLGVRALASLAFQAT
jgi:hypothetical protein